MGYLNDRFIPSFSTALCHESPSQSRSASQRSSSGFTFVEIMVVVVIIGLLTTLAIPAFQRIKMRSQVNSFTNDIRVAGNTFESFAMETGTWPPDGSSSIPNDMDGYLSLTKFNEPTPLGGRWDWDFGQFGVTAGLSVLSPTADRATMTLVGASIDDGGLATGDFRSRSGGYILVLEN